MNAKNFSKIFVVASLVSISDLASAGLITTYSDRVAFDSAVGATTFEDFTSTYHFPIPNGSLSSTSSFGTLAAGDIQPGAVYSTPAGQGNYFNIDAGGGFTGGFLDGYKPSDRNLTVTYSPLISAFGFDTNSLMPDFDITINFLSDPSYTANFSGIVDMTFFGFQSTEADIESVVISGNNSSLGFAIDNHAFGGQSLIRPQLQTVPEPTSFALMGLGVASLLLSRRRKTKQLNS